MRSKTIQAKYTDHHRTPCSPPPCRVTPSSPPSITTSSPSSPSTSLCTPKLFMSTGGLRDPGPAWSWPRTPAPDGSTWSTCTSLASQRRRPSRSGPSGSGRSISRARWSVETTPRGIPRELTWCSSQTLAAAAAASQTSIGQMRPRVQQPVYGIGHCLSWGCRPHNVSVKLCHRHQLLNAFF